MSEKILLTSQNFKWLPDLPPTIYANVVGVAMTPFDISILYGEIGNATDTEVQAIQRMKVSVAPELIPGLILALQSTLENFKTLNGPLRTVGVLPEGDKK